MWRVLIKLFVVSFYQANAGFFLTFFFVFFGSVQGGALVSYHLSLMNSMLESAIVLGFVVFCWALYALKCTTYFLKKVDANDGRFLHVLQATDKRRQALAIAVLFVADYLPVLIYCFCFCAVAFYKGHKIIPVVILLSQVVITSVATAAILLRFNNWIDRRKWQVINYRLPKVLTLSIGWYFLSEQKKLLLFLKTTSLLLLYVILVWNRDRYDNDSFLLVYVVMLMAHAIVPYLSVRFMEKDFAFSRHLPLSFFKRLVLYLIPYFLLFLPEAFYIFFQATTLPVAHRTAYCVNAVASLFLLTAVQYSEAMNRNEYLKAASALFFVSIFTLHVQAFWWWIIIQAVIGFILFRSGYYRYENAETG